MKKRLFSMLLSVLMVVSLFAGMSVSAYADDNVVEHTMAKNETVLQICNSIGINYYTCKNAIMKLNGFTDEAVFRKLSVGQVVKLPASDAAAAQIMSSTTSNTSAGNTVISGGTNNSSTSNANVAYWLIPYTMQKGETVAGVCNTLGISFGSYQDQIKTINNISSWSKVAAGKTLLLPTATKPVAGTSCYAVIAHYVSKGETAYGICQTYGVSYNANTSLLQSLNPKVSLTNVKYGTTLLVPVPTVVTVGSTNNSGTVVNPGTNNGSTTNNGSNNNSNNSSSTKTYKLSSGTVTNGKITFTVNGKTATSAAAGSTVTINASPNAECGLKSVNLKYADGSAVPKVTDGTFTMPACDVVVNATFEKGYYMGPISAHGSVTLYNAEGVITTTAAKGAEIKVVVKPNTGYTVSRIYIQKNNGTGAIVKDNMKSGDTFTMTDCPVFVRVEYKETATYTLEKGSNSLNGSFKLTVSGAEVSKAAAGATVEVACSPATGYTALDSNITVTNKTYGTTITVTEGKFIMPASDVKVEVTFTKGSAEKYAINLNYAAEGSVSASATEARAGTEVTLTVMAAKDGYVLDYYKVVGSFGEEKVSADIAKFTMPTSDVTVTPVFKAKEIPLTIVDEGIAVSRGAESLSSGAVVRAGEKLTISATAKEGYTAKIKVNGVALDGTTYTVAGSESSVNVGVSYEAKSYELKIGQFAPANSFTVSYGNNSVQYEGSAKTVQVPYGEKITITLSSGFVADMDVFVGSNKEYYSSIPSDGLTMPAGNMEIMVYARSSSEANALSLAPLDGPATSDELAPLY